MANFSKRRQLPKNPIARFDREVIRRDFYKFVPQAWQITEPFTPFLENWHIELISDVLQLVSEGEYRRVNINIPPRYMKSTLISVDWPAWEWGCYYPWQRWMFGSYSHDLSVQHSMARRDIIQSDWYQRLFPDIQLVEDQNTKTVFRNNFQGVMRATSMGGSATGLGGNRIVIDDALDPKQANSKVLRDQTNRDFDTKFFNRLDDKKRGVIVNVQQRLHDEDVTGHITGLTEKDLNNWWIESHGWIIIRITGIAEQYEEIRLPGRDKIYAIREKGDLLWDEREGAAEIAEQQRVLGDDFPGQYQQRPSKLGGNIIKRSWIKYYIGLPSNFDFWLQSWDCSFKDEDTSDFVCGGVWAVRGADMYLVDWTMARMDLPTTIQEVRNMSARWPKTYMKLVEDAANGPAVIQLLKRVLPGLIPVPAKSSKASRLSAASVPFQSGNVFYPDPSIRPDVKDVVDIICNFPKAPTDDFADMNSQAINKILELQGTQVKKLPRKASAYGLQIPGSK